MEKMLRLVVALRGRKQALENNFPWIIGLLLIMDLWPTFSVIICPAENLYCFISL
jgi:hypothetical protein